MLAFVNFRITHKYLPFIILNLYDFLFRIALKTGIVYVEFVEEISAVINKFDNDTLNLRLENGIRKIYTVIPISVSLTSPFYIIFIYDFTSRIALKTGSVEIVREISAVINKFDESSAKPDDIRDAVVNIFTQSRYISF